MTHGAYNPPRSLRHQFPKSPRKKFLVRELRPSLKPQMSTDERRFFREEPFTSKLIRVFLAKPSDP
jgi:hypothetical protein